MVKCCCSTGHCLPASVPKSTVPFLKELANHGWLAAGEVVRVSTVVPFFTKTMHEIPKGQKTTTSNHVKTFAQTALATMKQHGCRLA